MTTDGKKAKQADEKENFGRTWNEKFNLFIVQCKPALHGLSFSLPNSFDNSTRVGFNCMNFK